MNYIDKTGHFINNEREYLFIVGMYQDFLVDLPSYGTERAKYRHSVSSGGRP